MYFSLYVNKTLPPKSDILGVIIRRLSQKLGMVGQDQPVKHFPDCAKEIALFSALYVDGAAF